MQAHEPLQSYRSISPGSNRVFGLTFAGVFFLAALWPWLRHGETPRWWSLALALVFLVLALFAENRLATLNGLWLKLGLGLQAVVAPIIMSVLFFLGVTPLGLAMRAARKDILGLAHSDEPSYWRERVPPGPAAKSMKNQF